MTGSRKFLSTVLWICLASKGAEGIVNGIDAMPGWFNYQISLQRNSEHMCGGAIIGDLYVLTAAHCFLDNSMTRYDGLFSIVANEVDLNDIKSSAIRVDVEKIYVSTDFRPDLAAKRPGLVSTGDIAVVKLRTSLRLGENPWISKVNLPQRENTYEGVNAVVSGYGYTWTSKPGEIADAGSTNTLHYAILDLISNTDCQRYYGDVIISPQHLCAKAARQGQGTCGGDSGGPVVHKNEIIGVVSGGISECGDNTMPNYFTRVSSYLDFIQKVMSDVESPIIYIPG